MFSKGRWISIIGFITIFYSSKLLIMQDIIQLGRYDHTYLAFELNVSAQKLLFSLTIYLSILCLGFVSRLNNPFDRLRYKYKKIFILNSYNDAIFISLFTSINMIVLQLIILLINHINIELDILIISFSITLIYTFGFVSLYNLIYCITLKHILSLIGVIVYKSFWLIYMYSGLRMDEVINLNTFYYKVIVVELIVANIVYLYIVNKDDMLFIKSDNKEN